MLGRVGKKKKIKLLVFQKLLIRLLTQVNLLKIMWGRICFSFTLGSYFDNVVREGFSEEVTLTRKEKQEPPRKMRRGGSFKAAGTGGRWENKRVVCFLGCKELNGRIVLNINKAQTLQGLSSQGEESGLYA